MGDVVRFHPMGEPSRHAGPAAIYSFGEYRQRPQPLHESRLGLRSRIIANFLGPTAALLLVAIPSRHPYEYRIRKEEEIFYSQTSL